MVRVSSVATKASSWTQKVSTLPTIIVSTILALYRRCFRNDDAYPYLPHRSRFHKRSRSRALSSFAVMGVVMLMTFATLQWYLLSFMMDETSDIPSRTIDDPPWTTCPNKDVTADSSTTDICFLTSIFGDSVDNVDQPANVEWFDNYWCYTRFLLVTNLADLPSPGWTKFVTNTTLPEPQTFSGNASSVTQQQKNIVLSRHPKFLAWEALPDIVPNHCKAVVYMDGYLAPFRYHSWWSFFWAFFNPPWSPASPLFLGAFWDTQIPPPPKLQNLIQQVRNHPWGLSQVKQKYFDGLPMTTLLNNLVRDRKDTKEHVENTLAWFRSQESSSGANSGGSFQEIMPYYLNKYFAYDPNNAKYRELSSSFWKTYTTYGGVWRDQPLWAYFLHRFNVTPAVMTTKGTITKGGDLFQTRGKLGWDKHVYT